MFKTLTQARGIRVSCLRCTLSQLVAHPLENSIEKRTNAIDENLHTEKPAEVSVLDPPTEDDISHISTYLKPTFNLAAYANKSEIIQELVKLGVNLHYIEKKVENAATFLLSLKFDDIKEPIVFLSNCGVTFEDIGVIFTKNPFILQEKLEDLNVRINYLKYKRFTDEMISRILSKNPFWLSKSTQEIDEQLGFFQKSFGLTGPEVRLVAVTKPQLITQSKAKVKVNMFVVKEEMGFSSDDMKEIILKRPGVFMNGQHRLLKTFEYLHNVMKISHKQILQLPEILTCREKRLKERHSFLVKLNRGQFDPKKPNYLSLVTIVEGSDLYFATEVAKSSIEEYNTYLKTL